MNSCKIKSRMVEKGILLKEAARKMNLSAPVLGRKISGVNPMFVHEAVQLAEMLEVKSPEGFAEFFLANEG